MNSNENFDQYHHQKVVEEGNGKYVDLSGTTKENHHPHHSTSSNVCYQLNDEQFDKLVLAKFTSASSSSNQLSTYFADPHPLAFVSFIITLTPTCAAFMYWGDANPNSLIGLVGQLFFTGGLGLWIAGLMAYVQGSTFAMITYTMYGSFWLGLGFLDLPAQGLTAAIGGPTSPVFLDAFGAYVFSFGVFNLIMAFLSFRVNLAFVIIFVTVFTSTVTLSSAYWRAKYDVDQYQRLVKASGAILFVAAMDGWYLFVDSMLPSVGFKQRLPMGKFAGGFGRFK